MNVRSTRPLSSAREFKFNEMFFSTTDAKGIILSGNEVFARVSGFPIGDLLGKPHNVIRHPDMPRAAFSLLWTNLKQGRPFAGYVKNMAMDGSFYWVFVSAVPASKERYLSVRFKPGSPLLNQTEALYRQMLAAENLALEKGGSEKQAVAEGLRVATEALTKLGFANYDLFSHTALNREIAARDAALRGEAKGLFPPSISSTNGQASLAELYALGVDAYGRVDGLFRQLDGFVEFTHGLQEKAMTVLGTAEVFRLHALNVNITSQQFGELGGGVGVVAGFLSEYSRSITDATEEFRKHIAEVSEVAETINARVAMARLQLEMLLYFQAEAAGNPGAADVKQIEILEECFIASTTHVRQALAQLQKNLPRLIETRKTLTRTTMAIEMAQVQGLTEAVRIPEGETLRGMFAEFRAKVGQTRTQLDELSEVMDKIEVISSHSPRQVAAIHAVTARMQTGIEALAKV